MANSELAWPNGPSRVAGSGNGAPTRYVCQVCKETVSGVYRVQHELRGPSVWVCGGCRSAKDGKC